MTVTYFSGRRDRGLFRVVDLYCDEPEGNAGDLVESRILQTKQKTASFFSVLIN